MKTRTLLLSGIAAAAAAAAAPALAQSSYVGEVQLFATSYCPLNTVDSTGQTLPINGNTPLFSLIRTAFGGDGQTNFTLPDLRGRTPIGQGQGPGLANYVMGQAGGTESQTVTIAQMPAHSHTGVVRAVAAAANSTDPSGGSLAKTRSADLIYNNTISPDTNMAAGSVGVESSGGGQPFQNLAPYLTLRYCTVQVGTFPVQN